MKERSRDVSVKPARRSPYEKRNPYAAESSASQKEDSKDSSKKVHPMSQIGDQRAQAKAAHRTHARTQARKQKK